MKIAVLTESSVESLLEKGVLEQMNMVYNPLGLFEQVVLFSPYKEDARFAQLLGDRGIRLCIHGGRASRPWSFLPAVFRIRKSIKADGVRVVRTSNIYVATILAKIAVVRLGIPIVPWVGGDNRLAQKLNRRWHFGSRLLTNLIEYTAARLADEIHVPNSATSRYLESFGGQVVGSKVVILPWPTSVSGLSANLDTDDDLASVLNQIGSRENQSFIVCVGFVNRYKFSHVIFDCLEQGPFGSDSSTAKFVFCGDGELLQSGSDRFSKRADVIFLGFQPQNIALELIRRSSVVCIPMSGRVLVEAALLGKPVVVGDLEWHTELVDDGHSGLVVKADRSDEWRRALEKLLCDESLAQEFGRNLRAKISEQPGFTEAEKRLAERYQILVGIC